MLRRYRSLSLRSSVAAVALVSAFPSHGAGAPLGTCEGDRGPTATERFAFHSDPLVNLHHFLGAWAGSDLGRPSARPVVSENERAIHATLAAEDRDRWDTALLSYRGAAPSLTSQGDELDLLVAESRTSQVTPTDPGRETPSMIQTLERVMDLYCTHWWPAHDLANREWVGQVVPILERHEELFVEATIRLYASQWPPGPVPIDVSAYAPWIGYTSQQGAIVIHSTDELNAGVGGVEVIFHELQHTRAISATLARRLEEAASGPGRLLPSEIGHALIYATAGEIARRIALEEGLTDYTPLGIPLNFERWEDLVPAIEVHWLPAVRGEQSGSDGLDALIRAFELTPG